MPLPALAIAAVAFVGGSIVNSTFGRMFQQIGNSLYPNGLLPLPDLLTAWRHRWMKTSSMHSFAKLHGVSLSGLKHDDLFYTRLFQPQGSNEVLLIPRTPENPDGWTINERIVQSQQYIPSIDETLALINRGYLSQPIADRYLRNNCGGDESVAAVWKQMRFQIPGPSDLVRFAVREGFTPSIVEQYGYHHEFPRAILPWMDKQGFNQDLGFAVPNGGTNDDGSPRVGSANWSDLYWWSHWELPAVGQGYEMVFRLYGASDFGPSPDSVSHNVTFTENDMSTLLKTQDYPDYWRQRLLAINYQPFTRVDIRRMHQLDIASDGDVYHSYRAQGYPDDRAKKLLAFTKEATRQYKLKRDQKTVKQLCEPYSEGLISKDRILELAIKFDVDPSALELQLWYCDLNDTLKMHKAKIKAIRVGYLNGLMSTDELRRALSLANVVPQRADEYIELWELESQFKFKYVAAGKVMSWFKKRLIGLDETIARLYNLHILPVDISRMIREAEYDVGLEQQKQLDKATKEAAKNQQKAIDTAKKLAEKAKRDAEKKLQQQRKEAKDKLNKILSAFTDSNLKSWIKDKLITAGQLVGILRLKGWTDPAIHSYLVDQKLIEKDDDLPQEDFSYAK